MAFGLLFLVDVLVTVLCDSSITSELKVTLEKSLADLSFAEPRPSHIGHMTGKCLRQNEFYSPLLRELLTRLEHLLDLTGE